MKISKTLSVLRLLAILALFLVACSTETPREIKNLPDLVIPNLDGREIRLDSFKGQVVLLNFWATWCPGCQTEIPDLVALQDEYGSKGLAIVSVSVDQTGPEPVKEFSYLRKINYPVLQGGPQFKDISDKMGGISKIPTTFLIDRQGKIVKRVVGALTKSNWIKEFRPLL